jgi:hypothetical protein
MFEPAPRSQVSLGRTTITYLPGGEAPRADRIVPGQHTGWLGRATYPQLDDGRRRICH